MLQRFIVIAMTILAGAAMAAETEYTLRGRIMDTSDNWLPGVRVELKRAGVVTETDGNGLFALSFKTAKPLSANKRGVYEILELDKEGHLGRSVEIKNLTYFGKDVVEKMEPNPVGEDNVGFSFRMSLGYSLHGVTRSLRNHKPGDPIAEDDFRRIFTRKEKAGGRGPTDRVSIHAHVPKGAKKLNAVFLISLHGMGTIDHPRLRDFADRRGVALVGVLGAPVQRGFCPVGLLDEPIRKLADMAGHPELASAPVFTFGHSNGTGFATIYAAQRPERVIAWISYHSGWSFHLQFPGVEKVPGLVMHGMKDKWFEHGQERTVKRLRSDRNAAVAMMIEGNVGHGPVNLDATWAFIVDFCEAAMRVRLAEDGRLKPVVIESGWLGANYDCSKGGQQELVITPYAEYAGDRSTANWLPDEKFARIWQTYAKTDPGAGR